MGIFRRIVAIVLMMLIIIGGCGALLCELQHDCCRSAHEQEHTCCGCEDHATECAMHTQSVAHKCNEIETFNFESALDQRIFSKVAPLFALYVCIYNLVAPVENESNGLFVRSEVAIDSFSPSGGLLRAPPALV